MLGFPKKVTDEETEPHSSLMKICPRMSLISIHENTLPKKHWSMWIHYIVYIDRFV